MKIRILRFLIFISFISIVGSSCSSWKELSIRQMEDPALVSGNGSEKDYEMAFQSYREGASGGGASKANGGCGCN